MSSNRLLCGKTIIKGNILLLFMFLLPFVTFAQNREQNNNMGDISIVIEGFKSNKGKALIALSHSKQNYSCKYKPFKGALAKIENKKVEWVFNNIPYNEYAIKVFHDENGNNKLDTILGIPEDDFITLTRNVDSLIEKQENLKGFVIHAKSFPGRENFGAFMHYMKFIKDHHKFYTSCCRCR